MVKQKVRKMFEKWSSQIFSLGLTLKTGVLTSQFDLIESLIKVFD